MASTEIPPRKPFLPPPLYPVGASRGAEIRPQTNVQAPPMFLALQDEIEHSRRREAFWMSVLLHLLALVVFINGAKLWPKEPVLLPTETEVLQDHQYTFLVLPPDLQKNAVRPHASVLSDKNRVATSREAVLDRKVLEHVVASGPEGIARLRQPEAKMARRMNSARPIAHAPAEVAVAVAAPPAPIRAGLPQMANVAAAAPPTASPIGAQVGPGPLAGTPQGAPASQGAGTTAAGISAATSSAAGRSNVDVLSDTMGVDFGPYLSRVLRAVRLNWYSRIPESARAPLMKKGKVSIQFDILKTGQIAAMQVVGTSGDASLDGAAIGGINQSGPFPPLPPRFQGEYLALRFHFFYNPDTDDVR